MKNEYKIKNYNEEGLRLHNKKKYLLQKLYLLEYLKLKQEALGEYEKKKK